MDADGKHFRRTRRVEGEDKMKKRWINKPVILTAAAIALTAAVTVGSAMAYFTTYTTAKGSVEMNMGFTETIPVEEVDEAGKHVTIENIGDYDCFVRVKVFSDVEVDYKAGSGWEENADGYWYYTEVLPAGESTSELLVTYEFPVNTEEDTTEEFNIVVIQECTPVLFDEDGTPYANWDHVITEE